MKIECPYCCKEFKSWASVSGHVPSCKKNNGEYFIHKIFGPIHYKNLNNPIWEIKRLYPNITNLNNIIKSFKTRNILVTYKQKYSDEELLEYIKEFEAKYNRIPQTRDFEKSKYPNRETIKDRFGSWNNAIELAGFVPNYNDGYGQRTLGLDGILYRSNYEVLFCNKFLFNKETYLYEIKYPEHYKFYDFYLPHKNLYIEIDGGCRPQIMEEKIKINKDLNRNLLVLKGKDIPTFIGF